MDLKFKDLKKEMALWEEVQAVAEVSLKEWNNFFFFTNIWEVSISLHLWDVPPTPACRFDVHTAMLQIVPGSKYAIAEWK